MCRRAGVSLAGAVVLVGLWLLTTNPGGAADDKAVREAVNHLADAFARPDAAAVKKSAALTKKLDVVDLMDLLRLRTKKGLGVGPNPGEIKPDGIESMWMRLEKQVPVGKDLETQAPALERAAYITAAIAEAILDKCPVDKKVKEKDPKEWRAWSEDMRQASLELAAALKARKGADIKAAARKLDNSCVNCHGVFRE